MTPRQALLLLLALVGVAYVGALQAGFVWDDVPLVLRNRLTGDLANLPQFFAMDLWDGSPVDQGVSGYYRPLFLVSLAVDRALFGLSSVGAHAQSLLWHGIAVVLAFHLLRGWLGVERAFAAALVFGLHPIQSEAVIWVAAISAERRPDWVLICPRRCCLAGWAWRRHWPAAFRLHWPPPAQPRRRR